MDNWDNIFKSGGPDDYEDDDGFVEGDDDDFDDDLDDEEFYEDGEDSESYDIPDLPDIIGGLIGMGIDEAMKDWAASMAADLSEDDLQARITSVESIFDTTSNERIPGLTRSLLSIRRRRGASFGSGLCCNLVTALKKYTDKLLFGMIERLYLHTTRSITFHNDRICASVRIFWDPEVSPYPLNLNVSDISENPALVYLLVGDLVEELINDLEKEKGNTDRSRGVDAGQLPGDDSGRDGGNDISGEQSQSR